MNASKAKKSPAPRLSPLVLTADQAKVLWEICALSAYHPSGFTYTEEMTAVCEFIADRSGPLVGEFPRAAIAMCLARADIRERAYIPR